MIYAANVKTKETRCQKFIDALDDRRCQETLYNTIRSKSNDDIHGVIYRREFISSHLAQFFSLHNTPCLFPSKTRIRNENDVK